MRFVTQSVIQVGIRPFTGFETEVIMRCPGNSLRYVVRVTCKKQILCTIDDACHTFFVTFSCYFFVSFSFSDVVKDIMMSAYRFSLLKDSIIFLIFKFSLKANYTNFYTVYLKNKDIKISVSVVQQNM